MYARTIFISLVFAASCGKKEESAPAAKTTERPAHTGNAKAEPAAKQKLTPEFFGKAPAPLGPLAKLSWGMPAVDARAAVPNLAPKKDGGYETERDPTIEGVSYAVGLGKDSNRVDRLTVMLPKDVQATIEKAWGPGKPAKDTIGRPRTYWFDPSTGWRAYLENGFGGDDINLEIRPYLPIEKLLGDAPEKFAFAPDGILGASIEELRQRFGDKLIEVDAATAQRQQAEVGKFAGRDMDKALGKAKPSAHIELLPTEWGSYWTRVQLNWSDKGKVDAFTFDVQYEGYEPAKEELRALFEKHWGKPKKGKWIVTAVDVYHAKDPWIAVEDDTISHAWGFHVEPKARR